MVYTGFQIEPSYKGGYNVALVEESVIQKEKTVNSLNDCFEWIRNEQKENVLTQQYKRNFKFVNDTKLRIGDIVQERKQGGTNNRVVHSIHPDYGWICAEHGQINVQDIVAVFNKRSC